MPEEKNQNNAFSTNLILIPDMGRDVWSYFLLCPFQGIVP